MSGFSASNYGVEEQRSSGVAGVTPTVTDNSDTTAISAFSTGIQGTANIVEQVGQMNKSKKAGEAAEFKVQVSNQYDEAIEKYSAAVASGSMTRQQAATYLSQAKADLVSMGASAADLNKTEVASLKTLSGRALLEKTPEEVAEEANYKEFTGSKYWEYGASKEKQSQNRRDYERSQVFNKGMALEIENTQRKINELKGDDVTRQIQEKKLAGQKKDILNGLIKDLPSTFVNELKGVAAELAPIKEREGESAFLIAYKREVDRISATHLNSFSNIYSQGGEALKIQYEQAVEIVNRLSSAETKWEGSVEENKEAQAERSLLTTKSELVVLQDTKILTNHVMDSLVEGSAVLVQDQIVDNMKTGEALIRASHKRADGGPTPELSQNTEEGAAAVAMTKSMLSNVGKTTPSGKEKVDPVVVGKSVSAHLAYLGEASDGTDIKEMRDAVSFLADPDFASFVQAHPKTLGAKDVAKAQQALTNYQQRVGQSTLNLLSEAVSVEKRTEGLGKYASAHAKVLKHQEPTEEGLDIRFVNGQVVVVATEAGSREAAKQLTEKVNQPLTEVINASAALSKQSAESIFNDWLPQLWPSKYGEEPTQEEQGSQSGVVADGDKVDIPDNQYTNNITGEKFTVRNGIYTKGWE